MKVEIDKEYVTKRLLSLEKNFSWLAGRMGIHSNTLSAKLTAGFSVSEVVFLWYLGIISKKMLKEKTQNL